MKNTLAEAGCIRELLNPLNDISVLDVALKNYFEG